MIDYLIDLATRSRRRLMIRLVKGAYWDSEIKRAQMDGLEGYPVYTRKVYTDVSYLACAKKLLAVPNLIYPQFATHNAHTLAAIYQLAGQNYYPGQYEFQCLHGMGEPLYEQVTGKVADGKLNRPCRIYAPVGTHETLLAYLVRRLLETAPTPPSLTVLPTPRCRWMNWSPTRWRPWKNWRSKKGKPACRIRKSRCLATSTDKAGKTPAGWIWLTNTVWLPSPPPC